MNTSEVIYTAADLIDERGWTTGNGGRSRLQEADSALCVEGAIAAALGIDNWDDDSFAAYSNISMGGCPAARAVRDYLDITALDALWTWNDEWDYGTGKNVRTAAEVIETLRACAVIEAAKESARESELNASADALGRGVRV